MAKLEKTFGGDFDALLKVIEDGLNVGTCSLVDSSDYVDGEVRCSVRVFERYSVSGSNRVSLNVTIFRDSTGLMHLSAISSGGSQAILFKLNTFGENSFIDKLAEVLKI